MVFAGAPAAAGQANGGKASFLQVPEMIKLGETWKFVELPRAVDPEKPVVASSGGIRAAIFDAAGPGPQRDEAMDQALKALADYDSANAKLQSSGDKKDLARFHVGRVPLLNAIVKVAKEPEDQVSYRKQIVDSLVAAYQTGAYPKGRQVLEGMIEEGTKLSSYAAYRLIGADFVMRNEEPGGNFLANQKKWMAELEGFLTKFDKSDEAPEVWLQLGSSNEFNAEEDKARKDYTKLVENFPETPAGKKAAGALKRLDLVGKSISLKGTSLQGETVDTSQSRGKAILVVFWASWGGQSVRRELPDLVKLQEKFKGKGLEVVGVSLDNEQGRSGCLPQGAAAGLAADLRAGGHRQPAGHRVRHHLPAHDVPDRRPGQGRQSQPANRLRGRAPARQAPLPEAAGRGPGRSLSRDDPAFAEPIENWPESAFTSRGGLRLTPCRNHRPRCQAGSSPSRAWSARRPATPDGCG